MTENTKAGARGLILPATRSIGNPTEGNLFPRTAAELERLGLRPREVPLDGGLQPGPTHRALDTLAPERAFIAERQQPGSQRTQRRLARCHTAWTDWGILAYNLDTLAVRTG